MKLTVIALLAFHGVLTQNNPSDGLRIKCSQEKIKLISDDHSRWISSEIKGVESLMEPLFSCTNDIRVSLVPVRLAVEKGKLTSHQVSSQCLYHLVDRCVNIRETCEDQLRAKCYINVEENMIGVMSLIKEAVLNIEGCLTSLAGCISIRKCCNRAVEAVRSNIYDKIQGLGQQYENCISNECGRIKSDIASIRSGIANCSRLSTEEPATLSEKQQPDPLSVQSDPNEPSVISTEAPPLHSPALPFETTLTESSGVLSELPQQSQGLTLVAPTD